MLKQFIKMQTFLISLIPTALVAIVLYGNYGYLFNKNKHLLHNDLDTMRINLVVYLINHDQQNLDDMGMTISHILKNRTYAESKVFIDKANKLHIMIQDLKTDKSKPRSILKEIDVLNSIELKGINYNYIYVSGVALFLTVLLYITVIKLMCLTIKNTRC